MNEKDFTTKKAQSEADVISFYDEYAKSWDDRFGQGGATQHFLEKRWESFREVADSLDGADIALELGVGTGVYIELCSKRFKKIIAVDGSRKMLEVLGRKIHEKHLDNVSMLQANTLDLHEIQSDSVDLVYFFGLLEHIIDVAGFLREVKRVLRSGGVVIGVTPNRLSPWYLIRKLARSTGKHCSSDRYFSAREIQEIFDTNGFRLEQTKYWGAVPAGLKQGGLFRALKFTEGMLEKSFFKAFLGGITFKARKI